MSFGSEGVYMVMNLILFVTMYPVLFLLYFIFRSQHEYANGCLFAVNMKPEWIKEPEVTAIVDRFRKEMKSYVLFLAIVPLGSFLTAYMSIQLTIWMLWILLAIWLLCLPLVHANNRLKAWKREHYLYEDEDTERYVELKLAGKIRKVEMLPFLIPNLITFLGALAPFMAKYFYPELGKRVELSSIGWLAVMMWLCGVLLTIVAVWMDKQPVTVINRDSTVNLNYTRARKNLWKNYWLTVLWLNTAFVAVILAASIFAQNMGWMILTGSILYALASVALCFPLMGKLKKVEAAYEPKRELIDGADDDRHWIGGILYYNPSDRHTMVNKKVGIGTTMNLATPAGKAAAIFSTVILVATIPATCIWIILLEFTPIRLEVEHETLYAKHLNVNYEIPVEDIEQMEKITELPSWSKSKGTAMDTLEEGTFFIRNVGKCEVFLNPENTEFLHFSADGTEYYMSGYDDAQTEEIYRLIGLEKK